MRHTRSGCFDNGSIVLELMRKCPFFFIWFPSSPFRASIDEEWKSCEDLVKNLKVMQAGKDRKATITRTLMHLGADVYAHAEVANPETIYVFVGLGK